MPDAPRQRDQKYTPKRLEVLRINGVRIRFHAPVTITVPAGVKVERETPDRQSPGDAA